MINILMTENAPYQYLNGGNPDRIAFHVLNAPLTYPALSGCPFLLPDHVIHSWVKRDM